MAIKLTGAIAQDYDVMYRVRAKGSGWRPWTSGGLTASAGRGEPIVAMQVRLVERPEKTPVERTVEDGLYVVSPVVAKKLAVAPKATASVAPPPVLAASDSCSLLAS